MIQYVAVLPAYAGMFLDSIFFGEFRCSSPRVCGDVSRSHCRSSHLPQFSPRMRGCFCRFREDRRTVKVLPAYAGMFPPSCAALKVSCRSPRVCGDVSATAIRSRTNCAFSPRMRGCFHRTARGLYKKLVLPAYAGMFPPVRIRLKPLLRSPRVCGDVSGTKLRNP